MWQWLLRQVLVVGNGFCEEGQEWGGGGGGGVLRGHKSNLFFFIMIIGTVIMIVVVVVIIIIIIMLLLFIFYFIFLNPLQINTCLYLKCFIKHVSFIFAFDICISEVGVRRIKVMHTPKRKQVAGDTQRPSASLLGGGARQSDPFLTMFLSFF